MSDRRRIWDRSERDPVVGLAPGRVGLGAQRRTVITGGRVRAEELDAGELGMKDAEAVGHDFVGEVALEVDQKAVVTEAPLGGPRLELGQVDAAGRELARGCRAGCRGGPRAGSTRCSSCRGPSARARPVGARATKRVWLSGWSSTSPRPGSRGRRARPPARGQGGACPGRRVLADDAGRLGRRVRRHDLGARGARSAR